MTTAVQTQHGKPERYSASFVASRVVTILSQLSEFLERFPIFGLGLLIVLTLVYASIHASVLPLTCDEVYTYRIAQQPTLHELLAVSRAIDLHPPLHYLAERASLHLPFSLLLSSRVCSIVAFCVALYGVFSFVGRRFGYSTAFLAALMLWLSPALPYAWSNRPYALWVCTLALTCAAWQRASERSSLLWSLALFAATSLMVADYIYGLVCIGPLMLAEGIRSRRTKQRRPMVWLALLLPALMGVVYAHQIVSFSNNSFAPQYLDWSGMTIQLYSDLLAIPLSVFGGCIVVAALLLRLAHEGKAPPTSTLSSEEITLAITLLLLPIGLACLSAIHHTQFFPRYGLCATVGLALLAALLLTQFPQLLRPLAGLSLIAAVIVGSVYIANAGFVPVGPERALVTGVTPPQLSTLDRTQPLVIASPTGFTELNMSQPADIVQRMYCLTDRTAALQFSGSTVFEDEATTIRLLGLNGKTAKLGDFLSQHQTFYLVADYTNVDDWVPRYLLHQGASLRYLGKFPSYNVDNDVYFVTTVGK